MIGRNIISICFSQRRLSSIKTIMTSSVYDIKKTLLRFQERINECNHIPETTHTMPFCIQGVKVGEVLTENASLLTQFSDIFCIRNTEQHYLGLTKRLDSASPEDRSQAISLVTAALRTTGIFPGWRDELIAVTTYFGEIPYFHVERACYPFFGVIGHGVHINGFIRDPSVRGGIKLWVGTRSSSKQTFPGMRDHIVAGQISDNMSPSETVIKECEEEAGIPFEMAVFAKSVSAISHRGLDENGRLKRDILFCYDLELPPEFTPIPMDGEVESFELLDLEQICSLIEKSHSGPYFKPNVNLVILDFLIRNGFIAADSEGYFNLMSSLRVAL